MDKLVFEFDENMMTICLLANGWKDGWMNNRWTNEEVYGDYSLKEAFSRLLSKSNLYSGHFDSGWKVK